MNMSKISLHFQVFGYFRERIDSIRYARVTHAVRKCIRFHSSFESNERALLGSCSSGIRLIEIVQDPLCQGSQFVEDIFVSTFKVNKLKKLQL